MDPIFASISPFLRRWHNGLERHEYNLRKPLWRLYPRLLRPRRKLLSEYRGQVRARQTVECTAQEYIRKHLPRRLD